MIALPADEHEMSVEVSARGSSNESVDCVSFAETDDYSRPLRLIQVVNNLYSQTCLLSHTTNQNKCYPMFRPNRMHCKMRPIAIYVTHSVVCLSVSVS